MKLYLKEIRNQKKMSIRVLAKKADIGRASIERIERGNTDPRIGTLCKLAKALDVPVTALFSCD